MDRGRLVWLGCLLAACGGSEFGSTAAGDGSAGTTGAAGTGPAGAGGRAGAGGASKDASAGTSGSTGAGGASGATGSGGLAGAGGGTGTAGLGGGGTGGSAGIAGSGGGSGGIVPIDAGVADSGRVDAVVGSCSTVTDCAPGEYCNSDSGSCDPCGDTSRFRFGAPEKILPVSSTPQGNQRFPRVTHNGTEMLFRTGDWNAAKSLWLTPDFLQPGAQQSFGPPVGTNESESGALEVTATLMGKGVNFFFDRTISGPGSRHELYMGSRTGGTVVSGVTRMPDPFNTGVSTVSSPSSNYSIAIASGALRAWWMTDRFGTNGNDLVTVGLGAAPNVFPAVLNVTLSGGGRCARRGSDATPWVDPAGTFLLFRSVEIDRTDCNLLGTDSSDLFVVPLDGAGMPSAPAQPLTDVNKQGWDDVDGSMSPDLCWLYFASDEGAPSYEYDVFRAPRR